MTEQTPKTGTATATRPMFFNKLITLDRNLHADLKFDTKAGYKFAAKTHLIPITVPEFRHVPRDYPIIFSPGEIPMPFAVVGLKEGTNLFVDADGKWRNRTYIPAAVYTYPFILLPVTKDSDELSVIIDPEASSLGTEGEPLFVGDKTGPIMERIVQLTHHFRTGMMRTIAFGKLIAEHKLLTARTVDLSLRDGSKFRLDNFLMLDPEKIDKVANNIFLRWRKEDWLLPMFQYLQSADTWRIMAELESDRREEAKPKKPEEAAKPTEPDAPAKPKKAAKKA
jgi:hypothetical protein